MGWFLYDNGFHHERVKCSVSIKTAINSTAQLTTDATAQLDAYFFDN